MVRPFVLCEPGKLMLTSGSRSCFTSVAVVGRFFSELRSLLVERGFTVDQGRLRIFLALIPGLWGVFGETASDRMIDRLSNVGNLGNPKVRGKGGKPSSQN